MASLLAGNGQLAARRLRAALGALRGRRRLHAERRRSSHARCGRAGARVIAQCAAASARTARMPRAGWPDAVAALGADPATSAAARGATARRRRRRRRGSSAWARASSPSIPAAARRARTGRRERFAALVEPRCRRTGPGCSSKGPRTRSRRRRSRAPVAPCVARELPLRVLGAVLARAGLYVGNDSGVSHLAAACGAPTLALFGPTDPALWAPVGPRVRPSRGRPGGGLELERRTAHCETIDRPKDKQRGADSLGAERHGGSPSA